MPMSRTSMVSSPLDHFEPDENTDPQAQRRLRGHLEHIDYAAFAANKAATGHLLGAVDASRFQKLAVATANARAMWVAAALALSDRGRAAEPSEVARLAELRSAWNELAEAYEGLRRMVGRGYVTYKGE